MCKFGWVLPHTLTFANPQSCINNFCNGIFKEVCYYGLPHSANAPFAMTQWLAFPSLREMNEVNDEAIHNLA
ncbi:hypothetical protein [Helicobacter rodentium]|uniref:hypothetical protein n=1 Tax=Helicobacter rodentium TaxID=59617 RepID=UPI002557DBB0|nr:hypothetical protein [Helicobacter rodentium]